MLAKKKVHPKEKSGLHPRNKHRERYDFKMLIATYPELAQFVKVNNYQDESIDFFNPEAVKALNKALLMHFYEIRNWSIPQNYLCPPIPGRADYIHHIADLLYRQLPTISGRNTKEATRIKCLDVGVGANCVYPIIGIKEYGWSFIGSDIDPVSIKSAKKIADSNPSLVGKIDLRIQTNPNDIFRGIINNGEFIDLTICNPPFHYSSAAAKSATVRKLKNLKHQRVTKTILNFGGQNSELWCEGGEEKFVRDMILQSKQFSSSCFWFSTLISKQSNLKNAYKALNVINAFEVKTISMCQGNKTSRILAWTFLNLKEQENWVQTKWT